MTRILLISISIILLSIPCSARMGAVMMGGSQAASATSYADCSQIGSHAFVYFADYSGATDKGCKGESTAIDGTLSGATVVAGGTDPGTASPTSAGNVLKLAATNDYIRWAITSGDIYDSSEGQACFDFYVSASSGANSFFLGYINPFNSDKVTFGSTGMITYSHTGNGVSTQVSAPNASFADATWTTLCVRWSVSQNQVGIKVAESNWIIDSDADDVTEYASTPSYLYIGYGSLTAGEYIYIDNLTVDKESGI